MSLEKFLKGPKKSMYQLGYDAGRARMACPDGATADFVRGWCDGDSAADTHENECQVWGRVD